MQALLSCQGMTGIADGKNSPGLLELCLSSEMGSQAVMCLADNSGIVPEKTSLL